MKNVRRENLEQLLTRLSSYVSLTANGNGAVLVSSGFDPAREPANDLPIEVPDNLDKKVKFASCLIKYRKDGM